MREVVHIKLGGAQYLLRPTFEAYGDIEARLGKALRPIYTAVVTGTATLHEMSQIVHVGLLQVDGQGVDDLTGQPISVDAIAKRLYEQGAWSEDVIGPLADFLAALGWTPDQRKKIAAEVDRQEKAETPPLA